MSLHLLPKKSWHVWNEDNLERVRRDEAKAKAESDEKEKRFLAAEAEARLVRLRRAATGDASLEYAVGSCSEPPAPSSALTGNAEYEAEQAKKDEKARRELGIRDFKFEDVASQPWYALAAGVAAAPKPAEVRYGRRGAPLVTTGGADEDPLIGMHTLLASSKAQEERTVAALPPPALSMAHYSAHHHTLSAPTRQSQPPTSRFSAPMMPQPPHSESAHADVASSASMKEPVVLSGQNLRQHRQRDSSRSRSPLQKFDKERRESHRKHHHHHHRDHRSSRHREGREERHEHSGGKASDGDYRRRSSKQHEADLSSSQEHPALGVPVPAVPAPPFANRSCMDASSRDRLRLERLAREAFEHQRANVSLLKAADGMSFCDPLKSSSGAAAVAQALLETVGRYPQQTASLSSQYNPHLARQQRSGR